MKRSTGVLASFAVHAMLFALPARAQLGGDMRALHEEKAKCLGVPLQVVLDGEYVTNGEPRKPTKEEQKRMDAASKILGRIPAERQMHCSEVVAKAADRQMMSGVGSLIESAMAGRAGGAGSEPRLEPAEGGAIALRGVDWVPLTAEVTPTGKAALERALLALPAVLDTNAGTFRVDFYIGEEVEGDALARLAEQRLRTIESAVRYSPMNAGIKLELGKVTRDAEARIEFARK